MGKFALKDIHEGFEFEWAITIRPDRYPSPPLVLCYSCNGNCLGRRIFGMLSDPVDCWRCHNTGKIPDPEFEWEPKPPQELVDRLRKVYVEYWNEQQNKDFKLVGG